MQDFTVELPGLDEKQYHSEKGFKIAFRVDNSRCATTTNIWKERMREDERG
jgi:hypothetical protein